MKTLLVVFVVCLVFPGVAYAAGPPKYFEQPNVDSIPDDGRLLMYDPATQKDKNITGLQIKQNISDTPISSQPVSSTNPEQPVAVFRNADGVITSYITASGTLVLGTLAE